MLLRSAFIASEASGIEQGFAICRLVLEYQFTDKTMEFV
jgi:hypothetical protein